MLTDLPNLLTLSRIAAIPLLVPAPSLPGAHQFDNAGIAIAALRAALLTSIIAHPPDPRSPPLMARRPRTPSAPAAAPIEDLRYPADITRRNTPPQRRGR
jgi:hypothetical protein